MEKLSSNLLALNVGNVFVLTHRRLQKYYLSYQITG